jgi:hypothetical protein
MASISVIQPKKLTLFEEIHRISTEDEEIMFGLMEEIDAPDVGAIGFRWASEAAQSNQDRTLRSYVKYLTSFQDHCGQMLPILQIDEGAFPEDHDKANSQLRK